MPGNLKLSAAAGPGKTVRPCWYLESTEPHGGALRFFLEGTSNLVWNRSKVNAQREFVNLVEYVHVTAHDKACGFISQNVLID
jgi:hypothetical protein